MTTKTICPFLREVKSYSFLPVAELLRPERQAHCQLSLDVLALSVSAGPQQCPPDVEELADAYCMDTLDRTARAAFEEHYLTCFFMCLYRCR